MAAADPWGDLLDACQEGMALLDDAGVVIWANAAMGHACGQRPAELMGRAWTALLARLQGTPTTPADAAVTSATKREWLEARNQGQPQAWTHLGWIDADGVAHSGTARLRPWSSVAHPRAAALCSLQDTTALDTARREHDRAVERLQRAQEFGQLALYERALPLGAAEWNDAMFRLWGFDPAQGAPPYEAVERRIHPDDQPGQYYRRSIQQPGQYGRRFRLVLPDGQVRHVLSRWEVVAGPDGVPCRLRGVMVDDTEVYETAESYSKASAQLELAAELGHVVVWRHDVATGRVYCSDRAVEVLGIMPRQDGVPQAELDARVHPDDLARLQQADEASMGTDRPMDAEARFLNQDGDYRYVLTRRVLRRSALGEPLEFVGVALDVSEQVAETRRSQELARRLELAAQAAGLGIWSRDSDLSRGEWNRQLFEIVGWPTEAGVPTRQVWLEQIVHPDDRDRMARAHMELRSTEGVSVEHEFRIVRPDGQVRWLVNRASHTRRDGRSLEFGVTLDVTDRVATEAALRRANERIALATHGAGIGTWEIDLATERAIWDDQMYALYGQPDRDGDPLALWNALVHPTDLAVARRAYAESAKVGGGNNVESRVRQPDGSYRWHASRWSTIADESGRFTRLVGVSWDVHERFTAEAERQEKQLAQRESLAKSAFLARMSHELRTPLNAVLGFAQLLQFDPAMQRGEPLQKLRHIQTAGEHLLALVNDVLDLSGLESGELRLESGSVSLADLVSDALALMQPAAQSAGVTLAADPGDFRVRADRIRLRQVLLNLLSNAIKYNRPGGQVRVTVGQEGDDVWLAVADTGRGMRPEQLSHLFEPFNRLGVEVEGIEGAGVGLAVVRALVERMGGHIQASSQPDVGSRFALRLPVAAAHAADAPSDAAARPCPRGPALPHQGARTGHVLYVEDNAVNALLVQELVRSHAGLTIEIAPTGLGGVERALQRTPDLILIDMQLPDISGAEVLARLKAATATARVPCIALSANALPEDAERALAQGFVEYWTKPIDVADFLAALDRLFPAEQLSAEQTSS